MRWAKNKQFINETERDYASQFNAEQYISTGYYLHSHRNMEIYGVVKGKVSVMISGERKLLTDGQIAIIDELENHSYETDGEAEIFYVHIGVRYLKDFLSAYPEHRLPRWLTDAEYNQIIYKRVLQIIEMSKQSISELRCVGITCELFADIIERYGTVDKKRISKEDDDLITEIVQYIYEHYNENITLQSLSKIFFVSEKTLSKKISSRIHVDLRVFVNDIRVQKAVMMMDDPANKDKTLNDIVELCGFNNVRTFYRSFKRNFKYRELDKK